MAIAPITASSKSASSKTIKGACPPSSIETLFTVPAVFDIKIFPTLVEPVKEIFLTFGFSHSSSPTFATSFSETDIKFITPSGIPALLANSTNAVAVKGVLPAGFITTGHPEARAGATFLVIIAAGKFQGVIIPHTPTGCFIVIILLPCIVEGIVFP